MDSTPRAYRLKAGNAAWKVSTDAGTSPTAGVGLYLHDQGIDTAGSNGMSLFDLAAMMAFHLRQSRRDRILRGQQAARNLNVRFGRPKLIEIKPAKVQRAKEALEIGTPIRKIARMTGISPASVSRLKNTFEQASARL